MVHPISQRRRICPSKLSKDLGASHEWAQACRLGQESSQANAYPSQAVAAPRWDAVQNQSQCVAAIDATDLGIHLERPTRSYLQPVYRLSHTAPDNQIA